MFENNVSASNVTYANNHSIHELQFLFQTTAFFPNITNRLNQYYERIGGYETTYSNLILDVAHKKFLAKNLLIQAEDARRYNEYVDAIDAISIRKKFNSIRFISIYRNDLMRIYTNLHRLNEDMAGSYRIRQQNFAEMQKNLDAVNSVLKSSIRLRGKFTANNMWIVPLFLLLLKCLVFCGFQLGNMQQR